MIILVIAGAALLTISAVGIIRGKFQSNIYEIDRGELKLRFYYIAILQIILGVFLISLGLKVQS